MWSTLGKLARDVEGAVAPTVALSLFGLIAAGGVAFDYAQLAAMDTELQQATDNAALAAATQLDRSEDSQERATEAITGASATRLAVNLTKFANDGADASVEIETIRFCADFDDTVEDTTAACDEAEDGTDSRFIVVTTSTRTANYALTPIVAAFQGTTTATAVAGVQSSICNVAPLLVCTPGDDFPTPDDVGKGLLLKPLDGISGNYGLLDFGNGLNAVTQALLGFGLNGCQDTDDNQTEPGTKTPVTDAINTRMDVYAKNNNNVWSNQSGPKCNTATGAGCPAANTGKDMVLRFTEQFKNQTTQPTPTASCPANPKTLNPIPELAAPEPLVSGFDRDSCFYNAGHSCGSGLAGNIGDGEWDRAGYFNQYHAAGAMAAAATFAGKPANKLTRYDVYKWESSSDGANIPTPKKLVSMTSTPPDRNGRRDYTAITQCTYSRPVYGSGPPAYPEQKDRRVIPIVAANCDDLRGRGQAFEDYKILRVFDIFLTEPSQDRTRGGVKVTDEKEIFGEVVGPAETFEGGSGFQYYSRNKPYLVR